MYMVSPSVIRQTQLQNKSSRIFCQGRSKEQNYIPLLLFRSCIFYLLKEIHVLLILLTQYEPLWHYSYMAENMVASFVLELKDGKIPRCHLVEYLQRVVLRVLGKVIVQRRLLVPEKHYVNISVQYSWYYFGKGHQSYKCLTYCENTMYPFAGLWFALKTTFPLIDDDDMEASWLDDWVTLLDFELSGSASSSFLSNWPENGLSFNPAVCVQVYSSEI